MRVNCTCGSSAIDEANGRLPVETRRLLRSDGWLIEDHSRGWDLRWMPWTCSVGPEALVAISAAWIIADGTRSYLQGNPDIPFSTCLFAYSLFLLTHLSLCIGCWHPARQITARDGLVTCLAGTFPERCLGSLRRIRARGGRDRSKLVFTGTHVAEVELIGEPGLPDAVAESLLHDLLARVEHSTATAPADGRERHAALNSPAASGGVGSLLVASH